MMRFLLLPLVLFAVACGGAGASSSAVGGQCSNDQQCQNICTLDDAFGTGMCTRACHTDQDCPTGAVCIDKEGGICAVSCNAASDCADFGRAFTCKAMKRATDGNANVCRVN